MSFPEGNDFHENIQHSSATGGQAAKSLLASIVPYLMVCKQTQPRDLNIIQPRKNRFDKHSEGKLDAKEAKIFSITSD